jgi:hypothetical protein
MCKEILGSVKLVFDTKRIKLMKKYTEEYIQRRVKWYHECYDFIELAEYKKATAHAKKGLKIFPDDTVASFTYYSIMADYALSNKSKKFQTMHKVALAGMKNLLSKTSGRGISKNFKKNMKNEYYYQTKQFKKQYELGMTYYKLTGEKHHLYSSGVGGANYALSLARQGEVKRAESWAEKSIIAWEIYFEYDKNYYNPYVHYALAWGVLGNRKKMMKALKDSSKRCGKPMSYNEFTEVLEWIEDLESEK